MTARVGGSRKAAPKMSVTKPGREQQRTAEDHERAVDHLARRARGPPRSPSLKRRHAARPCERMSIDADDRVGDEQRDRPQGADRLPDLDDHVDLDDRDDDEEQDEREEHVLQATRSTARAERGRRRALGERGAPGPRRRRRGSRCRPTISITRQTCGCGLQMRISAPGLPQPPRDDREVEQERAVGEGQLAQVDHEVALGRERAREGPAAPPPRRDVLVSRAAQ